MFFVFFQTENLNQEEKEIYQKKMSTTTGTNEVPPWLSENNVKAVAAAAQSPIVQQATVNAINNGNINSVVNVIGNAIGLNQINLHVLMLIQHMEVMEVQLVRLIQKKWQKLKYGYKSYDQLTLVLEC